MSHGESDLFSIILLQHFAGVYSMGRSGITGNEGVIEEENTSRLTELKDNTIKTMADFFIGITVVFLGITKIPVICYSKWEHYFLTGIIRTRLQD